MGSRSLGRARKWERERCCGLKNKPQKWLLNYHVSWSARKLVKYKEMNFIKWSYKNRFRVYTIRKAYNTLLLKVIISHLLINFTWPKWEEIISKVRPTRERVDMAEFSLLIWYSSMVYQIPIIVYNYVSCTWGRNDFQWISHWHPMAF